MTIRYECEECGSVLKIKDELAGTNGKCPKCKHKFVVPPPEGDAPAPSSKSGISKKSAAASKPAATPKPAAKSAKPKDDDDFDPADFLMEGNDGPNRPSAGLGAPEPPKPTPGGRKPISPPGGAAKIQRPAEATDASANAHELLSKNAAESRAKASQMPDENTGPKYDFSAVRQQLIDLLPYVGGGIALVVLAFWMANYLMGDPLPLPELVEATGSVMHDGKAMSGVKVILSPVTAEGESTSGKQITLRSATGVTDENGFFRLEYMPGVMGCPLGKVKVFMEPVMPSKTLSDQIPPKYQTGGAIVEIKETGNTDTLSFNFGAN
ncbi:MAG: hypothetical protein KDA58_03500 [Planctomycetaceae bacterium]|nr:hypothetical protein [Planctomycetaceae bacterium]